MILLLEFVAPSLSSENHDAAHNLSNDPKRDNNEKY
jgi:hypothetical protein